MKFRMIWVGSEGDRNESALARERMGLAPGARAHLRYEQRGAEMVRREELGNGLVRFTPLANFCARIVRDIVCDGDTEYRRDFCIEAELAGQRVTFVVPAAEFSGMNWVLRQLGPQAIIYPGQQQHARAAIQSLSGPIQQERVFTHLGWTKAEPDWVYLQAGGAVGPSRTLADYQVRLPAPLQHFRTYVPADRGELVRAVRSSLRLLSVAPDRITLPLLAAVYRAPFGSVDFSLFLTGHTGTFKTALAALCQQHFGATMDASHLPANFASTANALEELAFTAKDALLVVDDFAPTGGVGDNALYAVAERLFRAAGNHQGRGRMSSQRRLSGSRSPRALILATGEEVPRGHSLRARLLIVDVKPRDVDRGVLSECQRAANEGLFAAAMGAYLVWIAARHEQLQEWLRERVAELRSRAQRDSALVHARLPTTLAELQSGWKIWLRFAIEIGAITSAEAKQLQQRFSKALQQVAANQARYHQASDPALRFLVSITDCAG